MSFLEVLPPAHAGSYVYLNRCLTTSRRNGIPIGTLAERDILAPLVVRYASSFPGADRRAVGSMWWQYYVSLLLPAALALRLRGVSIGYDPARVRAIPGTESLVTGFEVDIAEIEIDSDAAWFAGIIANLCAPIAARLGGLTGVSGRTLWANVASRVDDLRHVPGLAPRGASRIGELLRGADLDGIRNPLAGMVRDGRPRVCCLRDRLPGFETCGNCPISSVSMKARTAVPTKG